MSAQIQLGGAIVRDPEGNHHVQFDVALGPLCQRLVMRPDFARQYLTWLNESLPALIEEAERNDNMKGFQVVTDLPTLPPITGMNGHGRN